MLRGDYELTSLPLRVQELLVPGLKSGPETDCYVSVVSFNYLTLVDICHNSFVPYSPQFVIYEVAAPPDYAVENSR